MAGVSFDVSSTMLAAEQAQIDLLKITREYYAEESKQTIDVLTSRHDWWATNQLFRPGNVKMWAGGKTFTDEVFFDRDGNTRTRHVRPYTRDQVDANDAIGKVTIPLRQMTDNWVIERTEFNINTPGKQIFALDSSRKLQMQIGIAKTLEERTFKCPDSSTDDLYPYGIPYYLVPITTTQAAADTQDHQGQTITYGDATTTTTCAGIDASDSDFDLFRSYNARYYHDDILNDWGEEDVARVIKMLRRTKFTMPINAEAWKAGDYDYQRFQTTEDLIETMERAARANNDSLQADLGKFSGQVVIKGVGVQWNEEVDGWTNSDGNTSHTLLAVNLNEFKPVVLEGDFFRETGPLTPGDYHRLMVTHSDLCYNFWCCNRRTAGGRIDMEPMT